MKNDSMKITSGQPRQEKIATTTDIAKVRQLFDDMKWPLISDEFNDFCTMIANLESEAQKELILKLSKQFYWITVNDYFCLFLEALDQMISCKKKDVVDKLKIFIIPLMPNDNPNCVKSGQFLYYIIKSNIVKLKERYEAYCDIYCVDSILSIIESKKYSKWLCEKPDTFICPVDDYTGCGRTILKCVRNLESWGISKRKISVILLVAQTQGIKTCFDESIVVFSAKKLKKQISDFPNAEYNAGIMNEIEASIEVPPQYHFGYGQSEALVKLEHTPNNTFPVYWYLGKRKRTVPFPR